MALAEPAGGQVVQAERALMGSRFVVSVWAAPGHETAAAEAVEAGLDHAAALEARLSDWRADSETSLVNRAAGRRAVRVSAELRELAALSLAWAARTGGVFDPTGAPVFVLWRDARARLALPDPDAVQERLALVGWERVAITGEYLELRAAGMQLDFGAIGKGFAADRVGALLAARGFPDYLVDAGGDLAVGGTRGGSPWRIAIRDPRQRDGVLATWHASGDGAIATSGDYQRFFTIAGVRYSHIIDLATGWPARGVASVTVIAPHAVDADALATALFVMGPARGLAFLAGVPEAHALFVDDAGRVTLSPGLRLSGDRLERAP